jgi:glycosyltransferase involved in cell wall biosynthesis
MFVVTRADAVGGAQIHVRDVAAALLARGHEARVVTGRRGVYSEILDGVGVPNEVCEPLQRAIQPGRDAAAVLALRRRFAAFAPDLISLHSSKAGIVGRLAAAGRWPCLFTAHGWAFAEGISERRRGVYRALERALAPLAARIVCVSEHDRRLGVAAGIDSARLVTIHNGMPDVPPDQHADPGANAPAPVVVMVARFDHQKDHETLLRAVATVPSLRLDLVGDGPNQPAMERLAGELGVAERVRFLGQRRDVAAVLREAQVFALVSRWEGFPRSTLEAMRAGLPCLVTDAGGSAEAIVEGETGFVVPKGDAAIVADRLRRLADDADLRRAMGSAARRRYEANFTFERMFDRTLGVYRAVLDR